MRRRLRSASCPSSARTARTSSRAGPARLPSSPGPTDKQGAARDAGLALRERAALQRVRRERADSRVEQRARLPEYETKSKVAASDYDEEITAAVAQQTKRNVAALLPE